MYKVLQRISIAVLALIMGNMYGMSSLSRVPSGYASKASSRYASRWAARWMSRGQQPKVTQTMAPETQYYQPTTWYGRLYSYFRPSSRLEVKPYTVEQAAQARGIGAEQLEKNIEKRIVIRETKEIIKKLDHAKQMHELGYAIDEANYNMTQELIKMGALEPTPKNFQGVSKALEGMKKAERDIQEINKIKNQFIENLKKLK